MKVAVTGGSGLLGRSVINALVGRGHQVLSLDIKPRLAETPTSNRTQAAKVEHRLVDVRHRASVIDALANTGTEAVIHSASLVDLHLGRPLDLHLVNVVGARNMVAACRVTGITKLCYMSSAEVITGTTPLRSVDEATATYPGKHLTFYGTTKQAAEQIVLDANGSDLATCALRTYGLFGPGDQTVVPLYLSRLPTKTIRLIGDTTGRTDVVYAPNLAHAFALAVEQLDPDRTWAGAPLHVTDAEPVSIQRFLATLVEPLGYQVDDRFNIPRPLVAAAAVAFESLYRLTRSERHARPPITSHSLRLALGDYYLDSSRVRTELGYVPPVSRADAIAATQDWLTSSAGRGVAGNR
ncbi:MAG: NAD-dependent epimerase/dehydratase family protein [Actinomycetia bacterium]|nr:NAD-dependent epimerase/dehydratase family protein [Actinomycetes bacterium]MCP5032356.1 NAD-dependent epimerase/dehydratase family protein [Actinomycetes bacterium]